MINPLPKNGLYATVDANQVAGMIESLPEHYRITAYQIYFGTVNHCSAIVDGTLRAYGYSTVAMTQTVEIDDCDAYPGDPV